MIASLVAWSLQFFARVAVAAFLGNLTLRTAWKLIDNDDGRSDFPWLWLGVSLVVGGPLLALVTVLFPGPAPRKTGEVLEQFAASMVAFCLGCVIFPVGILAAAVRVVFP